MTKRIINYTQIQIKRYFIKRRNRKQGNNNLLNLKNKDPHLSKKIDQSKFEFLIQRIVNTDNEFPHQFEIPQEKYFEAITPKNLNWEIIKSEFDFVIKINNYKYSVSQEIPGLHIAFFGEIDLETAKETIKQIQSSLENTTGLKTKTIVVAK